jgi:glycosyltransferase involved in cell wall biosynthesis
MKISAHVLLKNEENFIYYSIMSVINYVDEILIWDTGSTDNTLNIVNQIKSSKVILKKVEIDEFREDSVRQQMLDQTDADWFIVLDADEVWWNESIKLVTDTIRKQGENLDSIVVPTVNMVGDMFHYQEKEAGRYHLAGKVGHYGLRAINRKIPGLHGVGEHGVFMWADKDNNKIEDRDKNKIKFLDAPYVHATHLKRSENIISNIEVYKRNIKLKYEIGNELPFDYFYPEVFFKSRPDIVRSPWEQMSTDYRLKSIIVTPLKKFRRRYFMKGVKHGY